MNRFDWFFTHMVYAFWSLFVRGENIHVVVLVTGPDCKRKAQAMLQHAIEELDE